MTRILTRLLLLGATLAIVGCSSKATTPKAAFEKLVAAAKSGDDDKVIACLDTATGSAMKELLALTKDMGQDKKKDPMKELKTANFTFGEEKIDGDKATLEVKNGAKTETFHFAKEDGVWKVSVPELQGAVKMLRGFKAMSDAMKGGK